MRVESDLEAFRATQSGQKLLSELDNSGHNVNIIETEIQNGFASRRDTPNVYATENGRGSGEDGTIKYNPSFRGPANGVPLNVLFHEGVHTYNYATGTLQQGEQLRDDGTTVNRCEQQCVGLEVKDGIEVEHPDGTVTTGNPEQLTENGIRSELGLQQRTRY